MCNRCGDDPCSCGLARPEWTRELYERPKVRETYLPLPQGISLDEFGVDLFIAIKLIGGMSGLQEHVAHAIHAGKGYQVQACRDRRRSLDQELRLVMRKLSNTDREAIFDKYPWVEANLKVNP